MILPIVIDTRDVMSQYTSLTHDDVDAMLDNIAKGLAASYAARLTQLAEQELKKTRVRFTQNIKLVDSGKLEGTVLLDYSKDKLVQMVEEGAAPFDMKKKMLLSPKVKVGKKGGKYLTIPFRWGIPSTIGEADNFAFILTKEVHKLVKKKPLEIQTGSGMRSKGLSLQELPQHLQVVKKRPKIVSEDGKTLFKEYEHKSPVHQGISKYKDSVTGQNSYRSFRRVSENSDDEAFIHPGIAPHHLVQKALNQFQAAEEMTKLLDSELSKMGLL